eukprot:2351498-Pyramimonas_sp.AAC.1
MLHYKQQARGHLLGGCVGLDQDPTGHSSHNIGHDYLQTLIKNCGMLYSLTHERWLTPSETLAVQNFPVYPEMSVHGESCSFSRGRDAPRRRGE